MIDKSKVACFSGHRKLPEDCEELRKSLEDSITELIKKGVMYFGAGGALGFDMLAEETVIQMKQQYHQIRLILVLPCSPEQQTLKWNAAQRERYNEIMSKADKVRIRHFEHIRVVHEIKHQQGGFVLAFARSSAKLLHINRL